ncbi:hypothetical protein FB451DRAFT_1400519 [Mycena latifolia]|nr:hypothetical protein FB451DRAFT_1400519 [Mycena latifolia]
MSFLSFSSAAGPSATILHDLSEYCASSDSPTSSLVHSDSSFSFISLTSPVSPPKSAPELPDILAQSDRFQSTSVKEKMLKALKFSTGSGFTRPAPSRRACARDRVDSLASIQGLPPSASDSFFKAASHGDNSTPPAIGLGILVPSSSTNELRHLCPFALRRPSPTPGIETSPDPRPSNVSPSPVVRTRPPAAASTRYGGLGHGLPSHMHIPSPRFASGFTISTVRSISQLLSIVPSGSYPHTLLNQMPTLTRFPRIDASPNTTGMLARLRAIRTQQPDGAQILKRAWAALTRFAPRKPTERQAGAGELRVGNPEIERRPAEVYMSVSVSSGLS